MRAILLAIFLAISLILVTSTASLAAFLVCDPQTGVTQYKLEITKGGQVLPVINFLAEADGSAKFDLNPYTPGVYTFKLYAAGPEGWWSDPSDPFVATKAGKVGGVRINP